MTTTQLVLGQHFGITGMESACGKATYRCVAFSGDLRATTCSSEIGHWWQIKETIRLKSSVLILFLYFYLNTKYQEKATYREKDLFQCTAGSSPSIVAAMSPRQEHEAQSQSTQSHHIHVKSREMSSTPPPPWASLYASGRPFVSCHKQQIHIDTPSVPLGNAKMSLRRSILS